MNANFQCKTAILRDEITIFQKMAEWAHAGSGAALNGAHQKWHPSAPKETINPTHLLSRSAWDADVQWIGWVESGSL
jgi:hypothetical protein